MKKKEITQCCKRTLQSDESYKHLNFSKGVLKNVLILICYTYKGEMSNNFKRIVTIPIHQRK